MAARLQTRPLSYYSLVPHRFLPSRTVHGSSRTSSWRGISDLKSPSRRRGCLKVLAMARRRVFTAPEVATAADLQFESPLKIVEYPDPRLRAKNKSVTTFDDNLKRLVEEMFDVMYKTDGIGLSAPQVGINVLLMVFNAAGERGQGDEIVLVNPKIYKYSKKALPFNEGCLSFPGIYADVERPASIKIDARDVTGARFTANLSELPARIFQHEYDHLQDQPMPSKQYRMFPDTSEDCVLCSGAVEDCSHLFFECPTARMTWREAGAHGVDISSEEGFWRSVCSSPFRREMAWQKLFATLWVIWLHWNEVIFRGRPPSVDAILHDARGLASFWHRGGSDPMVGRTLVLRDL